MAQLGIVTYNIAKDWDLTTLLTKLEALGYEGVELRTTHAHKVEVNLTKPQRQEIRKRFENSVVQLAGLGSAFEYQATDPAIVRKNIEGTKEYVRLAHDIGAPGVKVRPNGIPKGADLDATLHQIGRALHEVGEDAKDFGIEIRLEVHGGRDLSARPLRQDPAICRSPQRLCLLEFQPDRRQGRLDPGDVRTRRRPGGRSPSPRPDGREIPMAPALRAVEVSKL